MPEYSDIQDIKVARCLQDFIDNEVLPGIDMSSAQFWPGVSSLLKDLTPINNALLAKRSELQLAVDSWHVERSGRSLDKEEYRAFLAKIGYLVADPGPFAIDTENVDAEISTKPGPQLVVPVMNARFALNAANARWGSLYDALYGTDVIDESDGAESGGAYNPVRGDKVVAYARAFLDATFALGAGSHADVAGYRVENNTLVADLADGEAQLLDASKFVGYRGATDHPESILLCNHSLYVEIVINRDHPIGRSDAAGIADIYLESAITTIMDAEDSVAAVDAADKTLVYRNWLGLMKGDLIEHFSKAGESVERRLAEDRRYLDANGDAMSLPGRSLMLIRNVGHLMTNNAVLLPGGEEAPEGLLDAVFTVLIAMHDLSGNGPFANSKVGSIYIVKPKMHGPDEVQFAVDTFARVERLLGLPANTVKIGIMDEERRTTVNLRACIHAARERVIFINTGFLDRTGDEIHTSMQAGPMIRKDAMKNARWIAAYEDANVDAGLSTGFQGRAQIGKGMWAKPDEMAAMMEEKVEHPMSGANTAWTPSPTAATLHAMHYHQIDVDARQSELASREFASLDDILDLPLAVDMSWSNAEIAAELENNAQGILGYVVRWVEQGIGCSKVPNIDNIGLMEDRATLRISSQHIANWLTHGVCTQEQVMAAMQAKARQVDQQNSGDPEYRNMAPDFDNSIAFQAACDLVFRGCESPNGYTEPYLHARRLQYKASQ